MLKFKDWKGDFLSFAKKGDQVDSSIYHHFLGEVPPASPHDKGFLMGEAYTHDSKGRKLFMAFYQVKNRFYYGGLLTLQQWECFRHGFQGRLSREGNWIVDSFDHMGTATQYRNHLNSSPGWMQLHSKQDTEFYGVWINRDQLRTFTFCEGDITEVYCLNKDGLGREYQAICKFHEEC